MVMFNSYVKLPEGNLVLKPRVSVSTQDPYDTFLKTKETACQKINGTVVFEHELDLSITGGSGNWVYPSLMNHVHFQISYIRTSTYKTVDAFSTFV